MVKEVVVGEVFSDEMREAGEELVRRLDKAGLVVRAALWLFLPEVNLWRLIIASPEVRLYGPKKVYQKVQSVIRKMPETQKIGLQNVTVVDDNESLISALRSSFKTGTGISGIRFSRNTLNGHFIADAYIYRLT